MKNLTGFSQEAVNVGRLAGVIRESGRPVHVNVLAWEALREFLRMHGERRYAPGATYVVGEHILLDGQLAEVRAVRTGRNPGQGDFSILTLRHMLDESERWMAAGVIDAPAQDREVSEALMRSQMQGKDGTHVRHTVGEALDKDARFVRFQFRRGAHWCLQDLLPKVGNAELAKVATSLPKGLEDGEPRSETTETLVRAVWGIANDGSACYELAEFALGRALTRCADVKNIGGDLWVWKAAWEAFAQRGPVHGPRMQTQIVVPEGIVEEANDTDQAEDTSARSEAGEAEEEKDVEAWNDEHPTMGAFTLTAQQYYKRWLPLNKDLRKLFPPLDAGRQKITLRLDLLGYQTSLTAWVDLDKGQILGKQQLYDALHDQGVYPGAKLRLAFVQGSEYELATRPANKTEPIHVLRIRLEDGQLVAEEFEEKRRYDIEDAVFVADARFEDLGALFQQAEEAGNSVFGLMYAKCVDWWEVQGRAELRVTAARLFEAIHFDLDQGRMTSPATIAWELWRRKAFQPLGGGEYRFHPEHEDAVKIAARIYPTTRKPRKPKHEVLTSRTLGSALGASSVEIGLELQEVDAAAPQPELGMPQPEEEAPQPEKVVLQPEAEAPEPDAEAMQPEEVVLQPDAETPETEAATLQSEAEAAQSQEEVLQAEAAQPEAQGPQTEAEASQPEEVVLPPEAATLQSEAGISRTKTATPQPEVAAQLPAVTGEVTDEIGVAVQVENELSDQVREDDAERALLKLAARSLTAESRREGTPSPGKAPGAVVAPKPQGTTGGRELQQRKPRSRLARVVRQGSQRMWNEIMSFRPISRLMRLFGRK